MYFDVDYMSTVSRQQYFSELDDETRIVELRLQDYFRGRGYTVNDKRNDETCRLKDIDFEIIMQGQPTLNIEVKADKQMHRTGNILVELSHKRPVKGKTKGWYQYCEADLICYHDTVNDVGYMLKWSKMKPLLHGNFVVISFDNPHDIGTRTQGYLVPIEEAVKYDFILEQYVL